MINIVKSQPAPACLSVEKEKANGDYKGEEVLNRLVEDFHNKCYLCEEKAPSTINVEHLKPHKGDKDLEFDWNNLFLSCGHCNNTKLAKYDTILDCTDSSQKVLELLRFEIKPFPKEKATITALDGSQDVVSTALLLDEIYNGTTLLKKIESSNLRSKLIEELISFHKLLNAYFEEGATSEEQEEIKHKIRKKLSKASAFTAFKYWIVKSNEGLMKEFGQLLVN